MVYTGGFTGYIKFVGLTARNVYSLEGTALDLIGSPESNILVEEGFGFANRATLELKAAYINKAIIEYNEILKAWLLDLGATNPAYLNGAQKTAGFIKAATSYDKVLTKIAQGGYKNLAGATGARSKTGRA